MFFMPGNPEDYFEDTGYVSNSIADADGNFEENPVITINLEAGFVAYGLIVRLRCSVGIPYRYLLPGCFGAGLYGRKSGY